MPSMPYARLTNFCSRSSDSLGTPCFDDDQVLPTTHGDRSRCRHQSANHCRLA